MKRIPVLALLTLAALMIVPGALSQGLVLKADVPFDFTVANTSLPSGNYIISSPSLGLVRLRNLDKQVEAMVVTSHSYKDPGRESKLIFEKLGGEYFLHNVLSPGATSMNMDIAPSKAERKAQSREAKLNRETEIRIAAR